MKQAFGLLFRAWGLILLGWFLLGMGRLKLRESWLAEQKWVAAEAEVTEVQPSRRRRRFGLWEYTYVYTTRAGQRYQFNPDVGQAPQKGDRFPLEYVEAQPELHRFARKPLDAVELMGTGWVVALALGCAAHIMAYFFWLLRRL
jgi:hypothetical protein